MQLNSQQARKALESKLREIGNPKGWRDSIAIRPSADPTEKTQHIAEREMAGRSLTQNASLLREVRAALTRVDDGSYGMCVDCDDPIAPRRLAALPWASRCLACQQKMESGGYQDLELAA